MYSRNGKNSYGNRENLAVETFHDTILQEKAIALEKGSQEHKSLFRELLRAGVEKTWIEEEMENGNCNNDYDRFLEKIFMRPIKLSCPQQNGIILGAHQTLASEVIKLYLRFLMNVTSGSSTGYPVSSDE